MPVGDLMKQFQYGATTDSSSGGIGDLSIGRNSIFNPAQDYFEKSEGTWKALGFLAGLGVMIESGLSIYNSITDFQLNYVLVQIYTFGFATILAMLEYKDYFLRSKYRVMLEKEVHIMYTPFGRSGFYCLLGLLVASEGSMLKLCIGGFATIMGSYVFLNSKNVDSVLSRLLDSHMDEAEMHKMFNTYDVDNSGQLEPDEVYELLKNLNNSLTPSELEAAIYKLDKTRDGKISKDELISWWREAKKGGDAISNFLSL